MGNILTILVKDLRRILRGRVIEGELKGREPDKLISDRLVVGANLNGPNEGTHSSLLSRVRLKRGEEKQSTS